VLLYAPVPTWTLHDHSTAGGVKLKLAERDVLFGRTEFNALKVARALHREGYRVLLLHRTNHLDNLLGRMSRHKTGVLHCHGDDAARERCAKKINTSMVVSCKMAVPMIDKLRLRKRASELLFERNFAPRAGDASNKTGHVLRVEYEHLVDHPRDWLDMLRLLRLPVQSACLLRDEHQKRVVQTQQEIIRNWKAFSSCFRDAGLVYAKLLQPDRRPASGRLPRRDPELCPEGQFRSLKQGRNLTVV
jgi:hypothetical protein